MPEQDALECTNIKLFVLTTDTEVLTHIDSIAMNFSLVQTLDINDNILDYLDYNSVLIIDEALFYLDPQTEKAIIVITDNIMDIKGNSVSYIPKELFMTEYLDEFILWALEKSRLLMEETQRKKRKEKIEKMITDLQSLSRCSIFTNVSNG